MIAGMLTRLWRRHQRQTPTTMTGGRLWGQLRVGKHHERRKVKSHRRWKNWGGAPAINSALVN